MSLFTFIKKHFTRSSPKAAVEIPTRNNTRFVKEFGVLPEDYFLTLSLDQLVFLSKYPGIEIKFEKEKDYLSSAKKSDIELRNVISMYALTLSDDEFDVDTLIEAVRSMKSKGIK